MTIADQLAEIRATIYPGPDTGSQREQTQHEKLIHALFAIILRTLE